MIKAFGWTLLFWSLFILTNTIGDAVRFYHGFTFFGDMRLWHLLKFFWMAWLLLTGCFAVRLWQNIKYDIFYTGTFLYPEGVAEYEPKEKYRLKATLIFIFLLVWFMLFRWITHEALMGLWRS